MVNLRQNLSASIAFWSMNFIFFRIIVETQKCNKILEFIPPTYTIEITEKKTLVLDIVKVGKFIL